MTATTIRDELRQRVSALREQGSDTVDIGEVERVLEAILGNGEDGDVDVASRDACVGTELGKLVLFIRNARDEATAQNISEIREGDIPLATDELDAIVRQAEQATNSIMDATEQIENLIGALDDATKDKILDQITRIFEACSFQDITGQRVTKVVHTLQHIEAKIGVLVRLYGGETSAANAPRSEKVGDEGLLNGPQLPENAANQDDIDALFASLD
jgi:chemotaxis protein CheZ